MPHGPHVSSVSQQLQARVMSCLMTAHSRTSTGTCTVETPQKDQNPALDSLSQLFPHGELPHKIIPKLILNSAPQVLHQTLSHLRMKEREQQTDQDSLRAPPSLSSCTGPTTGQILRPRVLGVGAGRGRLRPHPAAYRGSKCGGQGPGFSHQLCPLDHRDFR